MSCEAIGIVGYGFVGTAVSEGFKHAFKIKVFDRNPDKRNVCGLDCLLAETDGPIFVCVPTPMKQDGSCDTSIVESVVLALDVACDVLPEQVSRNRVVVIKSTVPPGTTEQIAKKCRRVSLIFNPEFLTEANYIQDFKAQERIVLGSALIGEEEARRVAVEHVMRAYNKALPTAECVWWHATGAELFKYVCNTFLALKVSYANEIKLLCDRLGVNYEAMLTNILTDPRLGKSHWRVPGPDGKCGFSGSCFPKDINGLLALARSQDVRMRTLEAAWETNLEVRPEKDWEQLKGRAVVD